MEYKTFHGRKANELSAEEKKHFEIYKWMPHKKMLEATNNKLNKQLCN